MQLIDWLGVVRNALWITGLAVVLASLSYTSWQASLEGLPLRTALSNPRFQVALSVGMLLFAAGLAWGGTRWWERLAWVALLLAFGAQLALAVRATRGSVQTADDRTGESHERVS